MEKNREELKRSRVNSSQGAHSAGTYPGSFNMKRLGAVLLPLAFHQAFLTIRRYPFILLGKERRCESKKYLSQEYRTMTQPGFESGSQCSDHKATALPLSSYPMLPEGARDMRRKQLLHGIEIKFWAIACFVYPREVNDRVLKSFAHQLMKISGETGPPVYGELKKKRKERRQIHSAGIFQYCLTDGLTDWPAHWLSD